MHPFLSELHEGLIRCNVRQTRVLVAVSGGADSVALLCGLHEFAAEFSLVLCVGHLNHRLRASDSDDDAKWVRDLAMKFGWQCEVGSVQPAQLAPESSHLEETARQLRYRFLDEAAVKLNCPTVALAHTADDQVETVLHRILRGTGIAGLRGMQAVRPSAQGFRIVRPMLAIRRSLLEDYLKERSQSFRTDATNQDTTMTRNRLRHVVIPLLRDQINTQVDAAIHRLAEQASEVEDFLNQYVGRLFVLSLLDSQPDACRIDVRELKGEHRHVLREFFRAAWIRQGWPLQGMGFEQWNRLADVISTRETIMLPGQIEVRFHSESLLVMRKM